jgi:hypothetical protein
MLNDEWWPIDSGQVQSDPSIQLDEDWSGSGVFIETALSSEDPILQDSNELYVDPLFFDDTLIVTNDCLSTALPSRRVKKRTDQCPAESSSDFTLDPLSLDQLSGEEHTRKWCSESAFKEFGNIPVCAANFSPELSASFIKVRGYLCKYCTVHS